MPTDKLKKWKREGCRQEERKRTGVQCQRVRRIVLCVFLAECVGVLGDKAMPADQIGCHRGINHTRYLEKNFTLNNNLLCFDGVQF